jgi:RNA-dependent RNA polymerase
MSLFAPVFFFLVQVFVQYQIGTGGRPKVVGGMVMVVKHPVTHPGDIRLLKAVHVRSLLHVVNAIVFPLDGERPHPNEMSGSDLGGFFWQSISLYFLLFSLF